MDFKSLTSRKVAGIPVVYLVALFAIALLYMAIRMKPTADPTDNADTQDTADEEGDYAGLDSSQQPVFIIPQGSSTPVDNPVEDSNDLWARRAIEWLVAQGEDVSLATSAITKFVNSQNLSYQEGALRDKAVKQFGLPPDGLSESRTNGYNGPASKQGMPPLSHEVKGKSDNSFKELARLYYGSDSADFVQLIAVRNTSLNGNNIPVGTKVRVQAYHKPRYFKATSATKTLYAIASKNGKSPAAVEALNPGMKFPVSVGTRVRIA